jgi:RNA polymerase sigma-70 factor (ECF subfamily)
MHRLHARRARETPSAPMSESHALPPRQPEEARFAEIYQLLHRRAQILMRSDRTSTLQPTALVHEAWLRVLAARPDLIAERDDFLAYAGRAMRNILIDNLRKRKRSLSIPLGDASTAPEASSQVLGSFADHLVDVLALDEALIELAAFDARMARGIELLYFAGLDVASVARMVGLPKRSFERELATARAWLFRRLA